MAVRGCLLYTEAVRRDDCQDCYSLWTLYTRASVEHISLIQQQAFAASNGDADCCAELEEQVNAAHERRKLPYTAISSARLYWRTTTASCPRSRRRPPRSRSRWPSRYSRRTSIDPRETWARRAYRNLIYFHEADKGGHFAAWNSRNSSLKRSVPRFDRSANRGQQPCFRIARHNVCSEH
jgi:hypothetical protein